MMATQGTKVNIQIFLLWLRLHGMKSNEQTPKGNNNSEDDVKWEKNKLTRKKKHTPTKTFDFNLSQWK